MPISLFNTTVGDIKLGDRQVDKVYLGEDLVWPPDVPDVGVYGLAYDATVTSSAEFTGATNDVGTYVDVLLPFNGAVTGPPWFTENTRVSYKRAGLNDNNAQGAQLVTEVNLGDPDQEDALAEHIETTLEFLYEKQITYGIRGGEDQGFAPQTITLATVDNKFSSQGYPSLFMEMSSTDNTNFSTYLALAQAIYGTTSQIPFFITFGDENGVAPGYPPADPGYTYLFEKNLNTFSVFYDCSDANPAGDDHMLQQFGCTGISIFTFNNAMQWSFTDTGTFSTSWEEMDIQFVNQTSGTVLPKKRYFPSDFTFSGNQGTISIPFTDLFVNIPGSSNGQWLDLNIEIR